MEGCSAAAGAAAPCAAAAEVGADGLPSSTLSREKTAEHGSTCGASSFPSKTTLTLSAFFFVITPFLS